MWPGTSHDAALAKSHEMHVRPRPLVKHRLYLSKAPFCGRPVFFVLWVERKTIEPQQLKTVLILSMFD